MSFVDVLREALLITVLMGCAAEDDGVVFHADEAFRRNGELVFAVYAPSAGKYAGKVMYTKGAKGPIDVRVNGVKVVAEMRLNAGINTISLKGSDVQVKALVLEGVVPASYGATVGYRQYEAENATASSAEVLPDSRVYREFASEASGRSAVRLVNTGDYVED
jgi:hypothetical protein